jgi:hypothetical protein
LVNDRPEIDNELQSEPIHPVDYLSDFWTGLSDGRPLEDLSAPIIEPIDRAHTILSDTTYHPPSSIDKFLASRKETQGYNEDSYLPLNVISPSHLAVKQEKKVWVVESYGQFRGYGHPGRVKITTGTAVHLVDVDLGYRTLGFNTPHLLGIVGQLRSRELGYHIFYLNVHLHSKTSKIFPTRRKCARIAVPDHYIFDYDFQDEYSESTLGQRVIEGDEGEILVVLPPFRSWEVDMDWVLPEKQKIEEWYAHQQERMGNIWSQSPLDYGH